MIARRFAVALLIVACATSVAIAQQSEPITLVMWENDTAEWMEAARQAIAEFERLHPGIKVDLQPRPASMENVLPVRVAGDVAPDVVSFWGARYKVLAMNGMFMDLTPYIERHMTADELANFFPGQMEFFKIGSEQFALPQYAGTVVTYYNATLLNEHGLPPPPPNWDIDAMADMARKMTADRDGDGQNDTWGLAFLTGYDRFHYWVSRLGGSVQIDNDPRRFGLDQPEALSAMETMQSFYWADAFAPISTDAQYRMQSGRVGMEENGPWQLTQLSGQLQDVSFTLGIAEPPRGPAGRATMLSSDGYSVVASTKHPEEAFKLVQFLAGEYASALRATIAGLQPSHRGAASAWLQAMPSRFPMFESPNWSAFLNATAYGRPDPVFHRHSEVINLLQPALNDILRNGAPVRARIAEVAPAIHAILNE